MIKVKEILEELDRKS